MTTRSVPPVQDSISLVDLLAEVRGCRLCEQALPLGANPVVRIGSTARVLIVGQAPGAKVHASGIPWDDPSGVRLRQWLDMDSDQFYDTSQIAIMPMGFCYPGRGKSGDLPPRPECAPSWHEKLLAQMPALELTLLIGNYAQNHYLGNARETLTQRVQRYADFAPRFLPLPHPSPRNTLWLKKNPWFEARVVPELRKRVANALG